MTFLWLGLESGAVLAVTCMCLWLIGRRIPARSRASFLWWRLVAPILVTSAFVQGLDRFQYSFPPRLDLFFPFSRWAMFAGRGTEGTSASLYEWEAVVDGRNVSLNPATLFITTNAVVLHTKTLALAGLLASDSEKMRALAERHLQGMAQGLALRYRERSPTAEVSEVRLLQHDYEMPEGMSGKVKSRTSQVLWQRSFSERFDGARQ